jgi:UDP-2,3-diacylglucosamine hydrolase
MYEPTNLLMKPPALSGSDSVAPLERPVFVSDLHLSGRNWKTLAAFLWFLRTRAGRFRELFILGDLFEYWIGDDAAKPAKFLINELARYAARGHRLYLMQGNRDFLMGEDLARMCAATLIRSPIAVQTVRGTRILLAHGDEWCTLDVGYQQFRADMHNPAKQEKLLQMTVKERIEFAKSLRNQSTKEKTIKTPEMMDVVESDLEADLKRLGCTAVIHGHTHQPALYRRDGYVRAVIPDWDLDRARPFRRGWVTLNENDEPQVVISRSRWL